MSALKLYRGPKLEFRYHKRQGAPLSVTLEVDGTAVLRAGAYDLAALRLWMEAEVVRIARFAQEPEDTTASENLRGDQE